MVVVVVGGGGGVCLLFENHGVSVASCNNRHSIFVKCLNSILNLKALVGTFK